MSNLCIAEWFTSFTGGAAPPPSVTPSQLSYGLIIKKLNAGSTIFVIRRCGVM
jgi:hypothetical protein